MRFKSICFLLCTVFWAIPGRAFQLPEVAELEKKIGSPARSIQVVEPHLSTRKKQVKVRYTGYPAEQVLNLYLGAGWQKGDRDLEFRALDGYVSRIHPEHFRKYRAYLVFRRKDGKPFEVDNPGQNQKKVPLGPYYLVWDNSHSPELLALGTTHWPYQVTEILLAAPEKAALLPGDLASTYAEHAELAQRFCISCHRINGTGGDKMPINLAEQAKKLNQEQFMNWVLRPNQVKPGTMMPPLGTSMPEAQRESIARKLYDYLQALPVIHSN
jgi:cytochrome c2